MRTIYLDHNIIQYFSGRFPGSVDAVAEHTALVAAKSDPECHFVLSPWNIFEASSGTDLDRVEACANFIDSLNAWFIPDHPLLAKREMRRYVFKKCYGVDEPAESPFACSYSQHLIDMGFADVPAGKYTAAGMIRHYSKRMPTQLNPIEQQKIARPAILGQLQEAKLEGKMTAALDRQVLQEMFMIFFPERAPDGTSIPSLKRTEIVGEFVANQQEVLRECPTIWIDSLLSDYRIENPHRKPQTGDAIDLMHAVSALVSCNAFVSFDSYTRHGAERAARTAKTRCNVVPLLSALTV